jgi:hypothetical protein
MPVTERWRPVPAALWVDRYEPQFLIGRGTYGEVWSARDTLTGERVAVKRLRLTVTGDVRAYRKEAVALRIGRIPGVVRMLDEFDCDGEACIVMELVRGEPYGVHRSWSDLEGPTRALLTVLARLHFKGIVHQDLKPHNVLVHRQGVTVLDLGIARGAAMRWFQRRTGFEGSIAYAAPEQHRVAEPTPAVDLYAVGAMVFRALTGRSVRSWESEDAEARPSIHALATDAPPQVLDLVEELLCPDPSRRPDAIGALRRLGSPPPVVPAAAFAGLPETVEAADLRGLFHGPDRFFHLPEDAATVLAARSGGRRSIAIEELDAWVRAGLASWEDGAARLTQDTIRRLATGLAVRIIVDVEPAPEDARVFVLARALGSAATTELLARALRIAEADVEASMQRNAELDLAERVGEGWRCRPVVIGAASLRSLRGIGPDVLHALPPDQHLRARVALECGLSDEVVLCTVRAACMRALDEGASDAAALQELGLELARRLGDREAERDLLHYVVRTSASMGDAGLDRALRMVDEAADDVPEARALRGLLQGVWHLRHGRARHAEEVLTAAGPLSHPTNEGRRLGVLVLAALRTGAAIDERWIEDLFAGAPAAASVDASRLSAEGSLLYNRFEYEAAAARHEEAARTWPGASGRLSDLLNAAAALLEGGMLARCESIATLARDQTRALRLPDAEARAEYLLRAVALRSGRPYPPDEALQATAALAEPYLGALYALVDLAAAWREGDRSLARHLARRCVAGWKDRIAERLGMLVRAVALPDQGGQEEAEELARRVIGCDAPGIVVQVLGVLSVFLDKSNFNHYFYHNMAKIPPKTSHQIRELMSPAEAEALWRGEAGGSIRTDG